MVSRVKCKWLLLCLVVFLVLAACPLEDDPLGGGAGLDERLYGVWRFEYGAIVEEIRITREPRNPANLGALIAGSNIWEAIGFRRILPAILCTRKLLRKARMWAPGASSSSSTGPATSRPG